MKTDDHRPYRSMVSRGSPNRPPDVDCPEPVSARDRHLPPRKERGGRPERGAGHGADTGHVGPIRQVEHLDEEAGRVPVRQRQPLFDPQVDAAERRKKPQSRSVPTTSSYRLHLRRSNADQARRRTSFPSNRTHSVRNFDLVPSRIGFSVGKGTAGPIDSVCRQVSRQPTCFRPRSGTISAEICCRRSSGDSASDGAASAQTMHRTSRMGLRSVFGASSPWRALCSRRSHRLGFWCTWGGGPASEISGFVTADPVVGSLLIWGESAGRFRGVVVAIPPNGPGGSGEDILGGCLRCRALPRRSPTRSGGTSPSSPTWITARPRW